MLQPLQLLAAVAALASAPAAEPAQPPPSAGREDWQPSPAETSMMGSDDEAVRKGFTRLRKTIPVAFQGTYRRTLEECGMGSDSGLTIRPTKMYFVDGEAEVQRVVVEGPRKIVVTSIYDGRDNVWEKTETILLGKGGSRIAFQSAAGPDTRVRCPAGPSGGEGVQR